MKNRIWRDLGNTIFYIEYLSLYINRVKRQNKIIETVFLTTALIGIAGWNKYAEYNILWSILLFAVTATRILKSKFMVSEAEIATFQSLKSFYLDHVRDLDNLWFRYREKKISEKQAEKVFNQLNEQERLIIKVEKHDKLFGKEPMQTKAEKLARQKLNQYS